MVLFYYLSFFVHIIAYAQVRPLRDTDKNKSFINSIDDIVEGDEREGLWTESRFLSDQYDIVRFAQLIDIIQYSC